MTLLTLVQLVFVACQALTVFAAPTSSSPTVSLDQGTFTGSTDGTVNKYLGIPFAQPPVGDLRFRLPVANTPYTGSHSASSFGPACPQQEVDLPLPSGLAADAINFITNTVLDAVIPGAEDCLTLNVWTPAGTKAGAKLPVLVWIFGGGFELGGTSLYDQTSAVQRSVQMREPVIIVSMNYRVSAFGFLASQEVKNAGVGNLGLQDQRLALKWIQKYITAFGGDPTKVTIWGESAGAISVALHMVTNGGNTEGLFRGGIMESGSPIPTGDISHGQTYYDSIVSQTGCSGSSDTLACLRTVPYAQLKAAVDSTPAIFATQSLAEAWLPRVDGVFLTDTPQNLVTQGSVANVPFITGDCDDEGTLFALSSLNVTSESQLRAYLKTYFLPTATSSEMNQILSLYPADITQGSPFDTGILNAITPQYKRIAAMLGDFVFQAPRRYFLQQRSGKQNTWAFLSKRLKYLPVLGSAHATDLISVLAPGGDLVDYIINFTNKLDPNGPTQLSWPKYDTSSVQLMTFLDGLIPKTISKDTYRQQAMGYAMQLGLKYPL